MESEKLYFKISSGLKNIIGRELITNELVAVFELVKNSYDASATRATVIFDNNKIEIVDDGVGMNYDELVNKWLFVAYSEKMLKRSMDSGKYYVGAKGVGRFSCDRLGEDLTIYTKKENEDFIHVLKLDWDLFEKSQKEEFMEIPVEYFKIKSHSSINKQGTVVEITRLRDKWDTNKILKLRSSLSKLRDPFSKYSDFNIFTKVVDEDILNEFYEKLKKNTTNDLRINGIIINDLSSVLKEKTIYIRCMMSKEYITVELVDRGKEIYKIEKRNDTILHDIEMNIFYLNRPAKVQFALRMGVSTVNYGSIYVYKNSFRIYPYGEPNADLFNLDGRKSQGYARYLGSREILGSISITDAEGNFREVSSRDRGFEENIYTFELEKNYMELVHKPLEKYVGVVKWGFDKDADKNIYLTDIEIDDVQNFVSNLYKKNDSDKINISVSEYINSIIKKPTIEQKISNLVINQSLPEEQKQLFVEAEQAVIEYKAQNKNYEKKIEEKNKEISRLERQTEVFHKLETRDITRQGQISHHIGKVSNEIDSRITNIEKLVQNIDVNIKNSINKQLYFIRYQTSRLNAFKNIMLKSDFDMKSKTNINLYNFTVSYIEEVMSNRSYKREYKLLNKDVNWNVICDVLDISIIIDNLLVNAQESGADYVEICFNVDEDQKRYISVLSNTDHINIDNINKIFEYGYSTKINGTGIGLYHVKKILEQYQSDILVENIDEGVLFKIKVDM